MVGGSQRTVELLRLATLRSDDVVLVADRLDPGSERHVEHFVIEHRPTADLDAVMAGRATAVLVGASDAALESRAIRAARRGGLPVHVSGRPLVSDFTMLEFLEARPTSVA